MDTLNKLATRSKVLCKTIQDLKALEYPDELPKYWNNARRGIILLADQCHDLARDLPTKNT